MRRFTNPLSNFMTSKISTKTIGIDVNEANVGSRVGTGQYTYHILKRFKSIAPKIDFHLYHRGPLVSDMPSEGANWHYHAVGPTRAWLRLGLPLNLFLTRAHYHSFWSPAHYAPSYAGSPSVVTIHDLAYEYFPDLFLKSDLYKLKNWTRTAVKAASRVIAVSQATKDDLVKLYGTDPNKITVIHNGYDSDIFNTKSKIESSHLDNFNLVPFNYLLFLGTIQPRKNAIKLVQAFRLLKEKGYKGKLVLAGKIGWMSEESLQVIKNSQDARDIVMTGYVSDETRLALYRGAEVYVLPSLYEGFGVPAIEAMGCGVPVAVANNSSLPEVVGSAGVLFDERDPVDIALAIMELKKDREGWSKKSLNRAKHFSWDKCAEETLSLLTA